MLSNTARGFKRYVYCCILCIHVVMIRAVRCQIHHRSRAAFGRGRPGKRSFVIHSRSISAGRCRLRHKQVFPWWLSAFFLTEGAAPESFNSLTPQETLGAYFLNGECFRVE